MNDKLAVREFLTSLLHQKGDTGSFADADALITSGRLTSADAVEVVFFLEEKYGVDFAEQGFDLNNMDSLNDIMELIGMRTRTA